MSPDPCHGCPAARPDVRRRRSLLALAAAVARFLLPRAAWARTVSIDLSAATALQEIGGSVVHTHEGTPILLVRDSASTVKAVGAICTHKRTQVEYDRAAQRIECPKHGSRYDLQGKVLKGPSKKPLPQYTASLDGKRVVVGLPD